MKNKKPFGKLEQQTYERMGDAMFGAIGMTVFFLIVNILQVS